MKKNFAFARETDTYRLIILRGSYSDLDVILEETPHSRLTAEAQAVWDGMRLALKQLDPQLGSISLQGDQRDVALLVGRHGCRHHFGREAVLPGVIWVVSLVYVVVASQTFAGTTWPGMVLPMIGLTITAGYFVVRAIIRTRRQRILWEVATDDNP